MGSRISNPPPDPKGTLKDRAGRLPQKPGIYFFKNAAGEVVYIGKARSLRDRVRSYFQATDDVKVQNILSETADIDYILTQSEREAAFLENNFVQRHQPRFNVRLKDDKSFPYLELTVQEPFPRLAYTRRVQENGARYFGPFSPAHQARKTIRLLGRFFGIRTCREKIPGRRRRPCLDYDLHLCAAPCTGQITEKDYRDRVNDALLFLEGKVDLLLKKVRVKMLDAVEREAFEEAAHWRDLTAAVEQLRDKPRAISVKAENLDIFGFHRQGDRAAFFLFLMRNGKVRESFGWSIPISPENSDEDLLEDQISAFYSRAGEPPDKILLPLPVPRPEELQNRIQSKEKRKIPLHVPQRGHYRRLVELAVRNARQFLSRAETETPPLEEVASNLGLPRPPLVIEGYDISNTGGIETVGSMVVFRQGRPDPASYRKFKIRSVEGPNDVACLQEVLTRRLARLQREGSPPDLILIDGGKPQIHAAAAVLGELGFTSIPLASLAKRDEIVFCALCPDGLKMDRTSPALRLLQHIRDEAHRFAISFHRKRREQRSFASLYDGIPGIGPRRKAALLERFPSVSDVFNAPLPELTALIGPKAARALYRAYGNEYPESFSEPSTKN
jgi:excinuclease ABC subunit C